MRKYLIIKSAGQQRWTAEEVEAPTVNEAVRSVEPGDVRFAIPLSSAGDWLYRFPEDNGAYLRSSV